MSMSDKHYIETLSFKALAYTCYAVAPVFYVADKTTKFVKSHKEETVVAVAGAAMAATTVASYKKIANDRNL